MNHPVTPTVQVLRTQAVPGTDVSITGSVANTLVTRTKEVVGTKVRHTKGEVRTSHRILGIGGTAKASGNNQVTRSSGLAK